jgi:hypothetical protein
MWTSVAEQICLDVNDTSTSAAVVQKDWSMFFDSARPIYLEKSVSNSGRILWLQRNFARSRFIFVVRNGYAVAEGIHRRVSQQSSGRWPPPADPYTMEQCARQWVLNNCAIERDLPSVDHCRVEYEQFCSEPSGVLQTLWNFVGADRAETLRILASDRLAPELARIKNANARSLGRLSSDDIVAINNVAEEDLVRYGYHVLDPRSVAGVPGMDADVR